MGNFRFVLFAVLFTASLSFPQTLVGKLYTKVDADAIYGPVNTSVEISSALLNILVSQTTNYIMFRINDGNLIILGDQRKLLYPGFISVSPQEEMRLFSVSLVKQLINEGKESATKIELRKNNVLTITNGNTTLEFSLGCPPFCPD